MSESGDWNGVHDVTAQDRNGYATLWIDGEVAAEGGMVSLMSGSHNEESPKDNGPGVQWVSDLNICRNGGKRFRRFKRVIAKFDDYVDAPEKAWPMLATWVMASSWRARRTSTTAPQAPSFTTVVTTRTRGKRATSSTGTSKSATGAWPRVVCFPCAPAPTRKVMRRMRPQRAPLPSPTSTSPPNKCANVPLRWTKSRRTCSKLSR